MHLVASRQTGTATNILRTLLAAAGKEIRLKTDGVSKVLTILYPLLPSKLFYNNILLC